MNRTCITLFVAVALVIVGAGWGGRSPAARLLEVKGKATVVEGENFNRPASVYGTLYVDERLVVAKDAQVTLVFRHDGHVERIVAPGTFQITQTGCRPRTGVESVAASTQNQAVITKISKGPRGIVQGGVVMVRSPAPPSGDAPSPAGDAPAMAEPGQIHPINESTALAAKPTFSWTALPKATRYTLKLYCSGNRIWSATAETTSVEYSGDALKPGTRYTWEVGTTLDGKSVPVCDGAFRTANDSQQADAEALRKLLAQPEPAYLALAVMWYKQNGMIGEAIAANEQLAGRLTSDAAVYQELAELYFQAGRAKDGMAAEAKAVELDKRAEEPGQAAEESEQ